MKKFKAGIDNQARLSLGLGYATAASAPHTILKGFKNMVAFSSDTGYSFPQASAFLEAAKNAPAAGSAPAGGAAAEAPKEEQKKEEEEDVDMGGLFGGDDDY